MIFLVIAIQFLSHITDKKDSVNFYKSSRHGLQIYKKKIKQ